MVVFWASAGAHLWRTKWTKPPTQTSPNQSIVIKAPFEPRFEASIWSSNLKPGFDLEAFGLEAVGLEAFGLGAFDIAFVVSNQDHIGHKSGAYLDYRASMQSPLLRIWLQIDIDFNLKPYILNILEQIAAWLIRINVSLLPWFNTIEYACKIINIRKIHHIPRTTMRSYDNDAMARRWRDGIATTRSYDDDAIT